MIYFYKAVGRISRTEYYYASNKPNETSPSSCFPIVEKVENFTLHNGNPFDIIDVVYVLGNCEDGRLGLPSFNIKEVEQLLNKEITYDDFKQPNVRDFLIGNSTKVKIDGVEIELAVDTMSGKLIENKRS